ncbi:MAG: hypothetical protein ACI814_004810, partial [Mariniblastus sp.]
EPDTLGRDGFIAVAKVARMRKRGRALVGGLPSRGKAPPSNVLCLALSAAG